jgi:hypothetical protein
MVRSSRPSDRTYGEFVAYDVVAQSVALIESRVLDRVPRLSRRRRFVAMSVDVAGDVAVTTFARRGVGTVWLDTHIFAMEDGRWVWAGGGSGSSYGTPPDDLLADRPAVLPCNVMAGAPGDGGLTDPIRVVGTGGVQGPPNSSGWINYADIRASAAVDLVEVAGRLVPVPWHGRLAIVWRDTRPPKITALDSSQRAVGEAVTAEVR